MNPPSIGQIPRILNRASKLFTAVAKKMEGEERNEYILVKMQVAFSTS